MRAPASISREFLLSLLAITATVRGSENWTRFRGENGSGISSLRGIPETWTPDDFAWNVELAGEGHSCPIVWNDRLFVTSAIEEGRVRYVHCLDSATGVERWRQAIGMSASAKHQKSSWASSTPTTDGQKVFATFADDEDYLVSAYDMDGVLLWRKNIGPYFSQHGLGASPIVFEDMVIVPNDQDGASAIYAFDKETGRTLWSTLRPIAVTSYATPILYQPEGGDAQLICSSEAAGISALDAYTGRHLWSTDPLPARSVSSPVLFGGAILQTCGGGGQGKELLAVRPPNGTESSPSQAFKRERVLPYVPTPIFFEGHLYLWNDNGVVSCANAETGENIWTERIGGNYSGSPICVDGKIYILDEAGEAVVIAASPEYRLLGKSPVGEGSHSTPAVAQGAMYLRTFRHVACLPAKR